ncbi:hypothetical protein BOTBODRAFT_503755 [Botryobasidium botryosum FD-172 SS1]|uniref:Uncharacterized protein n=1 Tax=Botryobasidium botryosum (strain FD-172 SS1) TaxID=930990 RepID=A0A067MEJ4_BOTB1|nr:hypothetical protein BOTBODRAFT_503755 [Botryobasidium botryosum FD-172 SS1]
MAKAAHLLVPFLRRHSQPTRLSYRVSCSLVELSVVYLPCLWASLGFPEIRTVFNPLRCDTWTTSTLSRLIFDARYSRPLDGSQWKQKYKHWLRYLLMDLSLAQGARLLLGRRCKRHPADTIPDRLLQGYEVISRSPCHSKVAYSRYS